MTLPNNNGRQGFIIRIWREPREIEGAPAKWRGMIEATQDDKRQFIKSLEEILTFILPYLRQMGVEINLGPHLQRWWGCQTTAAKEQESCDIDQP